MTTVIAPQLPRANTQPLHRSNSAPAALGSPKTDAPKVEAPKSAPVKPNAFVDGFSKAGQSVKGWHDGAVKTATEGAAKSGSLFGGAKAAGGLAGGLYGVGSNIKGLVDHIQHGDGGQAIAQSALGIGRGVLGTVKGGLDTAAAVESALKGAKGVSAAAHVAEGVGGAAARAAGRFAPGLNIAMAGVDTAIAARTLADSKASVGDKVTTSITAAGSIAAATNIPIVSQVGAAVSTVSSIVGAGLHKLFG